MAGGAVIGGGGSISRRQLMFSDDGKLLILACGSALRLYSTATGEPVASLAGHTADITCVTSDPKSPKQVHRFAERRCGRQRSGHRAESPRGCADVSGAAVVNTARPSASHAHADAPRVSTSQVYTSSIDGSIRLWDYEARKCVRVLSVREAIQHVVINARLDVAYLSIHWREGASGRVLAYDLLAGKAGRTAMKTRSPAPVVCSAAGGLVATHDRHSLFVWRAGHEILQPLNLHHTKPYTVSGLLQTGLPLIGVGRWVCVCGGGVRRRQPDRVRPCAALALTLLTPPPPSPLPPPLRKLFTFFFGLVSPTHPLPPRSA